MRKLRLLFAAVTATLLMTSCSMIPGFGGAQSGVQACAAISETMQDSMLEISESMSEASTDPAKAAAAMNKLATDFTAARSKVTNAEVGAAMDKATASMQKMAKLMEAAGDDPSALDSEKLSAVSDEVQSAFADFVKSCSKF